MNGIIYNIQKFCVNDGPGIRTNVFFKGCPLRCVWCHNPESQNLSSEIMFYSDKCTGCGRCKNLTVRDNDFICYNGAKEICGKTVAVDEILAEVLKDKIFYDNSGGGITLSGGEPLYQFDFSLELLKQSKENGLHTVIETCGFSAPDNIKRIAEFTDLFLFDYKETNPILHKRFTGAANEQILHNLSLLNTLGKKVILRCPIIPGYNDRNDHFCGIAETANRYDCIDHVEIEPYHALGTGKYEALGRECLNIAVPEVSAVDEWLKILRSATDKEVKTA